MSIDNKKNNIEIYNDICFITLRDYYEKRKFDELGIAYYKPYLGANIIFRVLREISFKLGVLCSLFYNKKILDSNYKYYFVNDPLITRDFLLWLKENKKNSRIVFLYGNLIGVAKHLYPYEIPNGISIWTYSYDDSVRYRINYLEVSGYLYDDISLKKNIIYDVIFVGADKGRGDYLIDLQKQLNSIGLRTKFIIIKNGMLSKNKNYYSKRIKYDEIIELDFQTRAILNIVSFNFRGLTLREFESLFFNVKLITNNKSIIETDIYNKNNVYILEDNVNGIKDFLDIEYKQSNLEIINKYRYSNFIKYIINKIDNTMVN